MAVADLTPFGTTVEMEKNEGVELSEKILMDIEQVEAVWRESVRRKNHNRRPLLEHLASELFEYAYPRLHAKMRSGEIGALAMQKRTKVPLFLTAEDLDGMHRNRAYRDELAVRTIGAAWKQFRTQAVLGGQWNPQMLVDESREPAALDPYFFGKCLLLFPRVYQTWRNEQEDRFLAKAAGTMGPTEVARAFGYREGSETSEEITELCEAVWRLVVTAKPRIRAVMMLTVQGYSQSEIAERLNLTIPMVEGVLYRFRQTVRTRARLGDLRLPRELRAVALQRKRGKDA